MRIRMTQLLFRAAAGAAVFSVLLERLSPWGILTGAALAVLSVRRPDESDGKRPFAGPWLLLYGIRLLRDMAVSTVRQIRTILRPDPPEPAILHLRPEAGSSGRVLTANSVTLTPGTVTLEETAEDYVVLCADPPKIPEKRLAVTAVFEQRIPGKEAKL